MGLYGFVLRFLTWVPSGRDDLGSGGALMLRRMRLAGLFAFLMVPAVTGTSLAAPITPTPIFGGSTDQILPDANASFIGWSI
jgi:hypothetical protein